MARWTARKAENMDGPQAPGTWFVNQGLAWVAICSSEAYAREIADAHNRIERDQAAADVRHEKQRGSLEPLEATALEAFEVLTRLAELDWDRPMWDEEGFARVAQRALLKALVARGILTD